jgi:hypothetical protein
MADPRRSPGTEADTRQVPDRGATRSRPRWGLVLVIIIAIALLVLMIFLHLTGTFGPGIH